MISTNFFSNFSNFEKQPPPTGEVADGDRKTDDFAAFFCPPVLSPPIMTIVSDEIENSGEAADTFLTKENFPGNERQIEPAFSNLSVPPPDFLQAKSEVVQPKSDSIQQILANPENPAKSSAQSTFSVQTNAGEIKLNITAAENLTPEFSRSLPRLLGEISKALNSEKITKTYFVKSDTETNPAIEKPAFRLPQIEFTNAEPPKIEPPKIEPPKIEWQSIEDLKIDVSENGQNTVQIKTEKAQDFVQIKTEPVKSVEEPEIQEESFEVTAENLTNFIVKERKPVENLTSTVEINGKILEQIEPQMLRLASFVSNDKEKRILKMRLNPAELGAVEITLEKTAAGKISAHFHTENEKTQQILNDSLDQLKTSLETAGWQVGDLDVSNNSFSSNEGERRENQSQQFETAENHSAATTNFDGNSNGEDDEKNRLVNLRA